MFLLSRWMARQPDAVLQSRRSAASDSCQTSLHHAVMAAATLTAFVLAPASFAHVRNDEASARVSTSTLSSTSSSSSSSTRAHRSNITAECGSGLCVLSDISATNCFELDVGSLAPAVVCEQRFAGTTDASVCPDAFLDQQIEVAACVDLIRWNESRELVALTVDGRATVVLASEALHYNQFGSIPSTQPVLVAGF